MSINGHLSDFESKTQVDQIVANSHWSQFFSWWIGCNVIEYFELHSAKKWCKWTLFIVADHSNCKAHRGSLRFSDFKFAKRQVMTESALLWSPFAVCFDCSFKLKWNQDAKSKDLLYEGFVFHGRIIHDLCFLCPSTCKACKIETSLRVKMWGFQFQIFESGRFEETGGSIPWVWLWWVQSMHIPSCDFFIPPLHTFPKAQRNGLIKGRLEEIGHHSIMCCGEFGPVPFHPCILINVLDHYRNANSTFCRQRPPILNLWNDNCITAHASSLFDPWIRLHSCVWCPNHTKWKVHFL